MKTGFFAILGFVLSLALTASIAEAQATGSGGCYFNACDEDVQREREDYVERTPERKFDNTQGQQLMCVTLYGGSCVMMDQNYPEGQFCNCPGPLGARIDGYTQRVSATSTFQQQQQPQLAYQCHTNQGSCQLFAPVAAGSQCTCFTALGQFFPGIAQ